MFLLTIAPSGSYLIFCAMVWVIFAIFYYFFKIVYSVFHMVSDIFWCITRLDGRISATCQWQSCLYLYMQQVCQWQLVLIRPSRAYVAAQTSSQILKIKLNCDGNSDVFKNISFMPQIALNGKPMIWTPFTLPHHATVGIFLLTIE